MRTKATPAAPTTDRSAFGLRLILLARRWRQGIDAGVQASGLTDATWRPLLHLYLLGDGVHQKDLAAVVGIEGPSLVRLLDRLFAKGLVERRADPSDRRAKGLFLTSEGRALVTRIHDAVLAMEARFLDGFTDAELTQFARLFDRIDAALDRKP